VILEPWSTILASIVGGGFAGAGVAGYLARKLVEHRLEKDLERFKTELSERTEALKTQLSIRAHEESTALTRVDAERARAIASVFRGFRRWARPTIRLIAGTGGDVAGDEARILFLEAQGDAALSAVDRLLHSIADYAIYFEPETYQLLARVGTDTTKVTHRFIGRVRHARAIGLGPSATFAAVDQARQELAESYSATIVPNMNTLTEEFRRLLRTTRDSGDSQLPVKTAD
jgi:hypothetical protein